MYHELNRHKEQGDNKSINYNKVNNHNQQTTLKTYQIGAIMAKEVEICVLYDADNNSVIFDTIVI